MDRVCLDILREIVHWLDGRDWTNLSGCNTTMGSKISAVPIDSVRTQYPPIKAFRRSNIKTITILEQTQDVDTFYGAHSGLIHLDLVHLKLTYPKPGIVDLILASYPKLQTLRLSSDYESWWLPTKLFPLLPRSLTHLQAGQAVYTPYSDANYLEYVPQLPSGLLTLDMTNYNMNTDSLALLPKSLTDLTLHYSAMLLCNSDLSVLPRGLKHLNMGGVSRLTSACVAHAPNSLESLTLGCLGYTTYPEDVWATSSHLSNLQVFVAPSTHFDHNDFVALPPCLTKLYVSVIAQSLQSDTFLFLPRSLTSLQLQGRVTYTRLHLEQFPQSLRTLHLDETSMSEVTFCLDALPRQLTNLSLSPGNCIKDAHLSQLPRTLMFLNLYANHLVTNEGIQHLPNNLLQLEIYTNNNLTPACLPHLPRSLRRLLCHYCWFDAPFTKFVQDFGNTDKQ